MSTWILRTGKQVRRPLLGRQAVLVPQARQCQKTSGKTAQSGNGGVNTPTRDNDMSQFCNILKEGFASVSKNISDKLDNVSKSVAVSVESVQKTLNYRMDGLSQEARCHNDSFHEDMQDDRDTVSYADSDSDSADVGSMKSDKNKESFFKSLNKPPPAERVGEKVDEDLAEASDRFFRKPISHDEFKELKTKYVRPENVLWLRAPDLPMNVYKRLPSEFKNTDKILLHVQEQLCPVAVSLVYALEKLGEGDLDGGRSMLSDTIGMLGHVFRTGLTEKRRNLLKTKLPEDFKILTSEKCEPTPTSLLGDMSENSKKVTETEKLTSQMDRVSKEKSFSQRRGSQRGGPYNKGDGRKGNSFGKKYDNQKKNYDRKDDKGGRGNSRQSFHRGGHHKK